VGIFAAGAFQSDAASLSKGGGERAEGNDKVSTVAHKGAGSPWGSPANMGFSGFLHFSLHWKLLSPWLP
jgi:hypothetical protein